MKNFDAIKVMFDELIAFWTSHLLTLCFLIRVLWWLDSACTRKSTRTRVFIEVLMLCIHNIDIIIMIK